MRPRRLHTLHDGPGKDMIGGTFSSWALSSYCLNITVHHMVSLLTPSTSRIRYFAVLDVHRDTIVSCVYDADLWHSCDERDFSRLKIARHRCVTQLIVCGPRQNALISRGNENDHRDAIDFCSLLRLEEFGEGCHSDQACRTDFKIAVQQWREPERHFSRGQNNGKADSSLQTVIFSVETAPDALDSCENLLPKL